MRLACTSGICAHFFESGELTQLEFLDFCARDLACESVVLDVRHFPRTDDDYLAQIKKMTVDLGIEIAGLAGDIFLTGQTDPTADCVAIAVAIGAAMVITKAAPETAMSWSEQLERLNRATSVAKSLNVTLALRNAPGTFAATIHDCKRVIKEADSAWLRYALEPNLFEAAGDPGALARTAAALLAPLDSAETEIAEFTARFSAFRGPLVVNGTSLDRTAIQNATRRWQVALARSILNRT
ncbi:MAG: sugar phosphate isomerase/epimerase [Candidatus Eremiobacteraeota bacterium]|nr:sugar phosphate isomerase/epimerase [Candidatus Eremiobacteraeota bacterium]